MNREELKRYLPHREPMLLVDDAVLNDDGTSTAHYTVRGDEFFLQGHFPNHPIVPGVILLEIMAQSSVLLLMKEGEHMQTLYTGLTNVKFKSSAGPSDVLTVTTALLHKKPPFYFLKGEIKVDGRLCAQGEFSVALLPEKET